MPKFIDRTGEIKYNKYNEKMRIINCVNSKNITIEFEESGYRTTANYERFKSGKIISPFSKRVDNVGFLGMSKYVSYNKKIIINKEYTHMYKIWKGMLDRCYTNLKPERNYVYNDCEVCEEWYNFSNFAKWYENNFYQIDDNMMCLDKDILHKGNKTYSPKNCVFVPQNINKLFTKSNKMRGELPIGVSWDESHKKFKATCNDGNKKSIHLGFYETKLEAFNSYKTFKEKLIKQIADEYKNKIPKKLYEAMYRYEVEITD